MDSRLAIGRLSVARLLAARLSVNRRGMTLDTSEDHLLLIGGAWKKLYKFGIAFGDHFIPKGLHWRDLQDLQEASRALFLFSSLDSTFDRPSREKGAVYPD